MNLNVKYFGMIAESVGKDQQEIFLENGQHLTDFAEVIESLYPQLQGFVFQFAVNQSTTSENVALKEGDEIALLPPFAGG
jgi:molybdopterin converting factor small subunit